jgi:ankyrin repeat protein
MESALSHCDATVAATISREQQHIQTSQDEPAIARNENADRNSHSADAASAHSETDERTHAYGTDSLGRAKPPVHWERLDRRETAEENSKLRGQLQSLEQQMSMIRATLNDQMRAKEDQLVASSKQLMDAKERERITMGTKKEIKKVDPLRHILHPRKNGDEGSAHPAAPTLDNEINDDMRLYAQLGETSAVRHCLLRGADINSVDDEGNTALLVAVRKRQLEVVLELLKRDADATTLNRFRQHAMSEAVRLDFPDVVRALINAGVETSTTAGYSALFESARLGRPDVADALLQREEELVDVVNMLHETPLCVAIQQNHTEVVQVMMQHGADIEHTDRHMRTPMMMAAEHGRLAVLQMLLNQGAEGGSNKVLFVWRAEKP